ncbi:hypothetical protein BR10RB9215_C10190 [Brucella sp. 10RB9215]|nr:hypothetical protein BR10RB9215_C10190 [Brucella sp. 10RB9215]
MKFVRLKDVQTTMELNPVPEHDLPVNTAAQKKQETVK